MTWSESNTIHHYFGAGPAALPRAVKQQIQQDILEYKDTGLSILELSHRSECFKEIIEQAKITLSEIFQLPSHYHIIFMAGGATLQFDAVPLNLSGKNQQVSYLDTGFWSRKAGNLASKYVEVKYINGMDANADKTCCINADEWRIDKKSAYLHVTPNETINGVEFVDLCESNIPVVADLTSCIFMQDIEVEKYGVLYAATQKCLGIAGLSVVIVRDDLLAQASEVTPDLLRYDLHVKHNSVVNTASVFACYVANLLLNWVKQNGGLKSMVDQARIRSSLLYHAIDENPKFINNVCEKNRSTISVVFDSVDPKVTERLIKTAESEGLLGLQGHRNVGGVRASMYNGTPIDAAQKLADIIKTI